jgi:hypothetical protein
LKLIILDRTSIESMSSDKYPASTLYSSKCSYPRDYHKYTRPDDLEASLKQADNQVTIPNQVEQIKEYRTFAEAYSKGINDAKTMHNPQKWFMGGIASGLLLPILGTTMISLAAPETSPYIIPTTCEPKGYLEGYRQQTKISNRSSALSGGVIGTVVTVAVVLLIVSNK